MNMHHQAREMIKELTLAFIAQGQGPNSAVMKAIEAAQYISAFLHGDDKRRQELTRNFDFEETVLD
jgi:hypothetical protein